MTGYKGSTQLVQHQLDVGMSQGSSDLVGRTLPLKILINFPGQESKGIEAGAGGEDRFYN